MTADQPHLLRMLSATHFAEGLSNHHLQALSRTAQCERHAAGTVLFQEGTVEDRVFVVCDGHVRLTMSVPGRQDVLLMTAGPGDLVGWSGLISTGRMTATATTADETTLISLSGNRLKELCAAEPEIGCVLLNRVAQVLSQRLLATRLQLLDLFRGTQESQS